MNASSVESAARAHLTADRGGRSNPGVLLVGGAILGVAWLLKRDKQAARMRRVTNERAARQLSWGAVALSFSIVADSTAEHYRAGFYNPAMYVAPTISTLTLCAGTAMARNATRPLPFDGAIFAAATLSGLAGLGFHSFNTIRRPGGLIWQNLFYGAPIAAPLGLTSAGLAGLAARWIRSQTGARPLATLLGLRAGAAIAHGAAAGLIGTAVEAGLLHFRGAFQHRAMYVPVTVPPLAAIALMGAALRPTPARRRLARGLLRATAAVGIAGMAFHARGIQRYMGGWRNWSQNLLAGPPLPAPPSFTGMALAGLAGLSLLEEPAR